MEEFKKELAKEWEEKADTSKAIAEMHQEAIAYGIETEEEVKMEEDKTIKI